MKNQRSVERFLLLFSSWKGDKKFPLLNQKKQIEHQINEPREHKSPQPKMGSNMSISIRQTPILQPLNYQGYNIEPKLQQNQIHTHPDNISSSIFNSNQALKTPSTFPQLYYQKFCSHGGSIRCSDLYFIYAFNFLFPPAFPRLLGARSKFPPFMGFGFLGP